MLTTKLYTLDEFWMYISQPEREHKHYELIGGEIVEVVSDGYSSEVGSEFLYRIKRYLDETGIKGRVTGEAAGYLVSGKPYIPDVAYMSAKSQSKREQERGYNVQAPDIAVEVISPTDRMADLRIKVADYLNAGTVVWVANPREKTVVVHIPHAEPEVLRLGDTLKGGDVLNGFSVAVSDLFPEE